jgi:3-oxoacyl-[acyl-carrier protein] reductase
MENIKCADKVAIVTGGARGIGRAIVSAFTAKRIVSVIADIDLEAAEKAAAEVRASGGEAWAIKVDITQTEQLARMVTQTVARYGRLDILVNNAGILSSAPYDKVTGMEWDRVMEINVKGQFFASSEALKPMLAQGWGRIIFISSLSGRSGGVAAGPAYVASKAALIGIGRHLARKVARNGITVNVVAPGTTETDMLKMYSDEEVAAQKNAILMGRLGKPQEIADTVVFLASDSAAFITGAVIDVNGGMYMG